MTNVLHVEGLTKSYPVQGNRLWGRPPSRPALVGVDCTLDRGETLAVVGESGSGKTTLARCLLRLIEPDKGSIILLGQPFHRLKGDALRQARRSIQIVFQNAYSSMDPRLKAFDIVAEPLRIQQTVHGNRLHQAVDRLFRMVTLDTSMISLRPGELSGGQRRRLAIARALALEPAVLICDEPTSGLDVSTQASIINLLRSIQTDTGTAILFITHDLGLVRHIAHRIAVMHRGHIVETGSAGDVLEQPCHPYTKTLLAAVPSIPCPTQDQVRNLQAPPPP